MKKRMKGIMIAIGAVVAFAAGWNFGMTADATEAASVATQDIKTSDMFYMYPYYLRSRAGERVPGGAWSADYYVIQASDLANECIGAMAEDGGDTIAAIIGSFQNGTFLLEEALAQLGLQSFSEKCADEATKQLLMATMQDREMMGAIMEQSASIKKNWGYIQDGVNLMEDIIFEDLSDSQKKSIKEALGQRDDLFKATDVALSAVEMGSFIYFMESVNEEVLTYLINNIEDQELRDSLIKHRQYTQRNYISYITENYLEKKIVNGVADAFEKAVGLGNASPQLMIAEYFWKAYANFLGDISGVGSAEDLIVAMKLGDYSRSIQNMKNELISQMQVEPVLPEDVQNYEMVYDLYVASVRAFAEATKKVDEYYESYLSTAIGNIDTNVSFSEHIEGCKQAVLADPNATSHIVKGNPEKYYVLQDDMKVSDASDTMEDDTIYYANGMLYYGLQVEGDLDFPAFYSKTVRGINGNLVLCRGNIQIPENSSLYVTGNVQGKYDAGRTVYNNVNLSGQLNIGGNLIEDGAWNYTNIVMDHTDAILKVSGNIENRGGWNITAGTLDFTGSNIDIPDLDNIEGATLHIKNDGAGDISFKRLKYTKVEQEPIDLTIIQNEAGDYVMEASAPGHDMSANDMSRKIHVPEGINVKNLHLGNSGNYIAELIIDGKVSIAEDIILKRGTLDINGELETGGDIKGIYDLGRTVNNYVNLSGHLTVGGSLIEDGDYNYTNVTVDDADATLKVNESVVNAGVWYISAKQLDFNGNVNCTGNWTVKEGQLNFRGNESVVTGMEDIGNARVSVQTEGKGDIQFKRCSFAKSEEFPVNIELVQNEAGDYVMEASAPGHDMSSNDMSRKIYVPEEINVKSLYLGHSGNYIAELIIDGKVSIAEDIILKRGTLDINGELETGGDIKGIYDLGRTVNNYVNLSGHLIVGGNLIEDGADNYTNVTVDDADALLKISGNIENKGSWNLTAGILDFTGSNISIPALDEIGKVTLRIKNDGAGDIVFNRLSYTKVEQKPIDLTIIQNEAGDYVMEASAPGHDMSSNDMSRKIYVPEEINVKSLYLGHSGNYIAELIIDGKVSIAEDIILKRGTLDINGELETGGDIKGMYDYGRTVNNYVNLSGRLIVGGNLIEDGDYNYTNVIFENDNSTLKLGGAVDNNGQWTFNAGKIYLNGTGGGTVKLPFLTIERKAGKSPNLCISRQVEGYFIEKAEKEAASEAVNVGFEKETSLEGGTYGFDTTQIHSSGILKLQDDLTLKGNLVNSGTFKMTEDHHVIVEGDFTAQTSKNQTDSFTDGVLEVKGDVIQLGDYANFASNGNHELRLTGTDGQSVSYASPAKNPLNRLVILNDAEKGVTFENVIQMTGLFNHNRKQFALYKEGEGSQFIDYDKDGVTDEKDPYPMDAAISGYQMVVQPIEEQIFTGKPVEPEVIVKDEANDLLISGTHYTVTYEANDKPGEAKAIVTGIGRYKDLDPIELIFRIVCEHKYGEWVVTQEPTVEAEGSQYRECEYCKEQETEVIPKKEAEEPDVPEEPCTHSYKYEVTKKATAKIDGVRKGTCEKCGDEKEESISRIKSITVSGTYTYNGKTQKPKITVKDEAGKPISSSYYTVSCVTDCKNVKKHTVKITFKTRYDYSSEKTFIIRPKTPTGVSAGLSGHDDIKVSWDKATGTTGYAVYYKKSTASKYSVKYVASKYSSATLKDLTDGVKYNVKVYSYYKNGDSRELSISKPKELSIYTLKKLSAPTVKKSGTKVKVSWKNISGETGYQIRQTNVKTGKYTTTTYKTTTGTYKTLSATTGKAYKYQVRAYKVVGKTTVYGPWSGSKTYTR